MGLHKKLMVGLALILIVLLLYGCGNKTEIKYIVPTGHAVAELTGNEPIGLSITEEDSDDDSEEDSEDSSSTNTYITDEYATVVSPSGEAVHGSYTPYEAPIEELDVKICSINDVILGYVGCYYNEDKTEATVTLKDTGRGDLDQMWFYVVFSDRKAYMKSEGFTVGNMNDYKLLLSEWSKTYSGKIQRILITPVIKEGEKVYACNNRQLLLIHEDSCREMVG